MESLEERVKELERKTDNNILNDGFWTRAFGIFLYNMAGGLAVYAFLLGIVMVAMIIGSAALFN